MDENGKILELRKPYLCGYRGPDLVGERYSSNAQVREQHTLIPPSTREQLAGSLTQSFLSELEHGLVVDNVDDYLPALEDVIAYYMALLCPNCRQKVAERLLNDIPAMLARASEYVPDMRSEFGEFHLKEK
jgi:hypothetical protein